MIGHSRVTLLTDFFGIASFVLPQTPVQGRIPPLILYTCSVHVGFRYRARALGSVGGLKFQFVPKRELFPPLVRFFR